MPAMFNECNGCCAARYWYDFGTAHGRQRAKNIDEFALWFSGQLARINFGVTNSQQSQERKWLEELGWHAAPQMDSGLIVHSISSYKFREVNAKRIEAALAEKRAEEIKKREEELARRHALEEQKRERTKQLLNANPSDRVKTILTTKKLTVDDIRFFSTKELNRVGVWSRSSYQDIKRAVCFDILDSLGIEHFYYSVWDTRTEFAKKVTRVLAKKY